MKISTLSFKQMPYSCLSPPRTSHMQATAQIALFNFFIPIKVNNKNTMKGGMGIVEVQVTGDW